MKRVLWIVLLLLLLSLLTLQFAAAQGVDAHGSIRGAVYVDVNGDGKCVGTGVKGEVPAAGVDLTFVSEDKHHTLSLYTGSDGTYGLVEVGQSNWTVTVKPSADWVVTSKASLVASIWPETLLQQGINFCVAKKGTAAAAAVFLPETGADHSMNWTLTLLFAAGVMIVLLSGWQIRRRVLARAE